MTTMTLQGARGEVQTLTQYLSPQNPSVIVQSNGDKIVRIYQNCICCNEQRFNLKEIRPDREGGTRMFWCAPCGKRAMNFHRTLNELENTPDWRSLDELFHAKLFELKPKL